MSHSEDLSSHFEDWKQSTVIPNMYLFNPEGVSVPILCMGLAGESGEVIDIMKKVYGHNKPLDREHLVEELGDLLWYYTAILEKLNVDILEVIAYNKEKLQKRYHGS